jgi:hypothetical protein
MKKGKREGFRRKLRFSEGRREGKREGKRGLPRAYVKPGPARRREEKGEE